MNRPQHTLSLLLTAAILSCATTSSAKTIPVGHDQLYKTVTAAAAQAMAGDTILFHGGVYAGGEQLVRLAGKPTLPIVLMNRDKDTVIIRGGAAGWALRQVAWLHISGIIFEQQTGNGFNVDDGGVYDLSSHHIYFTGCTFRDIAATGNNDLLKLSGLDTFAIRDCFFLNGAKGGSGIDMVGCHNGTIIGCRFERTGSNAVQAKGGSQFMLVEHNLFKDCGDRTLNLGGSTGLPFFRPQNVSFEAADMQVVGNVMIGSQSPVNFVGCTRVDVVNNTIYRPEKWVIRILQENKDTIRFVKCSNNSFSNNVIVHGNKVVYDCNIGGNTDAGSFHFSHNLWYNEENKQWRGPVGLPVTDSFSIIGKDPLFRNAAANDLSVPANSPAAGKGHNAAKPR